jgi:polyketide biosynthesis enoyl-CoA hydratase PksH
MALIEHAGPGIVRVTLRSPGTRNRLDGTMLDGILGALDRAETAGLRAFVLDAEGPDFCSGLALSGSTGQQWRSGTANVRRLLVGLSRSPLVTVALVNGIASGGGVGLAAACDHVIAGPDAVFRMTEVRLGLIPAVILPVVAARTGRQTAFTLALTARALSGHDAAELGLADEAASGPEEALRKLLTALRSADPGALRALKNYRTRLFGTPSADPELVFEALGERMADPRVRARIDRLSEQGALP